MREKIGATIGVILLSFVGLAVSDVNAAGQMATGTIQGAVLQSNGRPVKNVAVTLMTAPGPGQAPALVATTNTDNQGRFTFSNIRTGDYTAQASFLSTTASSSVTVHRNVTSHVVITPENP